MFACDEKIECKAFVDAMRDLAEQKNEFTRRYNEQLSERVYEHICEAFPDVTFDKSRVFLDKSTTNHIYISKYNDVAVYQDSPLCYYKVATTGDVTLCTTDFARDSKGAQFRAEDKFYVYLITHRENGRGTVSAYGKFNGKWQAKVVTRRERVIYENELGEYIVVNEEKTYLNRV